MTDLATLVTTPPSASAGTPTGYGTWRLVVEVLLPETAGSVVGVATVGSSTVSRDAWVDMAEYCTGLDVDTGASLFGDHPLPSVAHFTFRSPDHRFAPWGPLGQAGSGSRWRAGCPIRASLFNPTGSVWRPLFTGEIETAHETTAGVDAVAQLHVTALDPVAARLAGTQLVEYDIDPDAAGADLDAVIDDLVAAVGYPYGTVIDVPVDDAGDTYRTAGRVVVNGTAVDVLRRIGDAVGRTVAADRYGRLAFVRRRPQLVTYSNAGTPAADPNVPPTVTFDTALDAVGGDTVAPVEAFDQIVNVARFPQLVEVGIFSPADIGDLEAPNRSQFAAGSTVAAGSTRHSTNELVEAASILRYVTAEASDVDSIRRYGRRERVVDLPFPIWFGKFVGDQLVDNLVDRYAHPVWRVDGVELDGRSIDTIADVDVGSPFTLDHLGATFTGHVAAVRVRSTPKQDSAVIDATLSLAAYDLTRGTP